MIALSKADNGVVLAQKYFVNPLASTAALVLKKMTIVLNFVMNCISSFTALGAIQFAYYSLPTWVSPRLK